MSSMSILAVSFLSDGCTSPLVVGGMGMHGICGRVNIFGAVVGGLVWVVVVRLGRLVGIGGGRRMSILGVVVPSPPFFLYFLFFFWVVMAGRWSYTGVVRLSLLLVVPSSLFFWLLLLFLVRLFIDLSSSLVKFLPSSLQTIKRSLLSEG